MDNNQVQEKLTSVKDPELNIDIVTLGLVRDISVSKNGKEADIVMTLTTPFCPFADDLITEVEDTLKKECFLEARVDISFDPPWEPPAELRAQLGV